MSRARIDRIKNRERHVVETEAILQMSRNRIAAFSLAVYVAAALPTLAKRDYVDPPACGHHEDIWGFTIDLPAGKCAEAYLHGISLRLSPKDAPTERLFVVWASYNSGFLENVREMVREEVAATQELNATGRVRIISQSAATVGGSPAIRLIYRYTGRDAPHAEHVTDTYCVPRAYKPNPAPLDYYEYQFRLETTPEFYERERPSFEKLVASVTFTEPER